MVQINFALKPILRPNFPHKYGFRLKLKANAFYATFYANQILDQTFL